MSDRKLLAIPSVAKTNTSPAFTGITAACTAGTSDPTMPPRVTSDARPERSDQSTWCSTPSTFPTPSHVIVPRGASKRARLITTPRLPLSAPWQRCNREGGFLRIALQRADREPGGRCGFLAVAKAVHDGDEDAVVDWLDEVEVAGFTLSLEGQRSDAPMDECLHVAYAARHWSASTCAS